MKKLDCTLTATYAAPQDSTRRSSSSIPIKEETTIEECQSFHYPQDLKRPAAATSDDDNDAAVVVTNQEKQEEEVNKASANDNGITALPQLLQIRPASSSDHTEIAKTATETAMAVNANANATSNANDSVATTTTTTLPQEISKLESLLDYDPSSSTSFSSSSFEEKEEEDILSERQAEKFASHVWTFCKLQKHGWKLYHLKTDIGYGFIPPTSSYSLSLIHI